MIITSSIILCLSLFIKQKVFPVVKNNRSTIINHFWTFSTFVFMFWLVFFPKEVYQASLIGLDTWFNTVLPALLPFFVISELLVNLGAIRFMGVLLEPVMRPLFNLPGTASFVVAMSYTSGFPIGAILTSQLLEQKLINIKESQRLLNFTNNSSPLFMLGAVAVGMFNNPVLGYLLALCHYLANLTIGLILGQLSKRHSYATNNNCSSSSLLSRAIRELQHYHLENPMPFAMRFSKAITKSINTLFVIGGFIIIFSVLIKICTKLNIITLIENFLLLIFKPLNITKPMATALSIGLFETTLGCKTAASITDISLFQALIIVAFILGWSGLSVIAQVSSIISDTTLKIGEFIMCRLCHGLLAIGYTAIFFRLFINSNSTNAVFTFNPKMIYVPVAHQLAYYGKTCLLSILILFFISIIVLLSKSIFIIKINK